MIQLFSQLLTPKHKATASFYWMLILGIIASGCQQEVKLDLPTYEPKIVMEFYLEDNKPLNCLLQESINFTDTTRFKLIENALVVLSYQNQKDTLLNTLSFDPYFGKIYNYHNNKIIQLEPGIEYEIYIKDSKGRIITGKTQLNETVPIDTLVYNFNSENQASAGLIFKDREETRNYYRIVAFQTGQTINPDSTWDITFDDLLFNGRQFSFYTGYAFDPGDTIIGRLYHLTEDHHKFTQSVNNAQSSNGNPFGQPANIISNLKGGLGIFTTLQYSEKQLVVQ